jgi:hypothetical protein
VPAGKPDNILIFSGIPDRVEGCSVKKKDGSGVLSAWKAFLHDTVT